MKGYVGQRILGHPARLEAIRYAGALLAVVAGTVVASGLRSVLDPSIVLLTAILVASWFSGFWPALLASVLATLSFDYFFELPLYSLKVDAAHIRRLPCSAGRTLFVRHAARPPPRAIAQDAR